MLIRIEAPHFVAGAYCDSANGNVCVEAAPIIKWMIGKDVDYIVDYCNRKEWKVGYVSTATATSNI